LEELVAAKANRPVRLASSRKKILSWALYDWANSAFATTVIAAFFPLFFKKFWAADLPAFESTAVLGYANSVTSLILAATSPVFGAMADEGRLRKRMLALFTVFGAGGTLWLSTIGQGQWINAAWAYSLAVFGFTAALTFYDALLVEVAGPGQLDRVSGLGYALGYLGGGVLLAVNVWMYMQYGTDGVRWSFVSVALWWLLFSIPLFLNVPEPGQGRRAPILESARRGFQSLKRHIRAIGAEKKLLYFLIGYLFYIDGVNTIIKMAVDYGLSIGLESSGLIKAILLVQFIGFPSAVGFGFLGEKISPLFGIWLCLITYFGVTIYSYFLNTSFEFYMIAAVIGVVQGGIQALSRSFYARLVPPDKSAEYFGFFNMTGKFSAIVGPSLVAAVAVFMQDSRASILVITIFFIIGGIFLSLSQRTGMARK
jgi:UMF1 family MFS transporter